MNHKELRIGNYVLFNETQDVVYAIKNSGIDFFRGKTKKGVITQGYIHEAIKPIPLTEEWLIKFGFERKSYFTKLIVIECVYYKLNDFIVYLLKDSFEIELIRKDGNQFNLFKNFKKEIHILQNLYFALTNEELIIKQ